MEPIIITSDEHMMAFNKFPQDNTPKHAKQQGGKRSSKDSDGHSRKRTQQSHLNTMDLRRAAEVRAIAAVEVQLGEPLRGDCPTLGVEFDALPVGAFTTYMSSSNIHGATEMNSHGVDRTFYQQETKKQKIAKGHVGTENEYQKATPAFFQSDNKKKKGSQEYSFIPDQLTGKQKLEERINQPAVYGQALNPLPSKNSVVHGTETFTSSVVNSQRKFVKNGDNSTSPQIDGPASYSLAKSVQSSQQDTMSGFSYDNRFANHQSPLHQVVQPRGSSVASENHNTLSEEEDDEAKLEQRRKNEEARIAKEVELYEKRIRREIERQDIARRKRDEQIKKDLEKQRREAERAIRDKQREEERILREHKREMERREKFMEKESKRVERQKLKDESRRQREVARMKLASERALAKRLAKESMDLIDDERLELLEVAATAQGLSSIYLLDGETLNELESYKGYLKNFPPAAVKMKMPFAVSPWINSKENVGKLFMVWKFLSAFADILGLWPFTLDEFVQAFHDYDPRLLGEVHIALLRTLVKDVEDVAKASSSGLASNQYAPGFSGAGHPLLVEAAFAWGFDISEWGKHLNPQTWPEILRQFALSAGYGPKWKKLTHEADVLYENEGRGGDAIVDTLRSGQAVEKAVSQMQGKGGQKRRKRNRLTPGTVKFAAFHVLSIEGQSGLSILEVADRIQKSGLRDLSTSKTPEASVAAALSRDTKLFERVAPSTYCVREAYRKDPEDAENIMQRARERIRIFENLKIEEEEPEKEVDFVDEAERDDDSDEDVDDVEVDDLEGGLAEEDNDNVLYKGVELQCGSVGENGGCFDTNSTLQPTTQVKDNNINTSSENANSNMLDSAERNRCIGNVKLLNVAHEEMEIDESHVGESWVQGLMEGDYCDLSVEERLNALVVLVEAVNEGNTIRVALEERLEAASSLKRKLWAEAQIDRKRYKEEQAMKALGQSDEGCRTETSEADHGRGLNEETKEYLDATISHGDEVADALTADKSVSAQRISSNQELSSAQVGHPGEKPRAQLKAEIGQKVEEIYAYRFLPIGFDRRYNRYWQFITSNNRHDYGCGRIYFESASVSEWRVIDSKESFDALLSSLDTRGTREAQLHCMLRKCEDLFMEGCVKQKSAIDRISHLDDTWHDVGAIHVEFGKSPTERNRALEQYQDFDKWLWTKSMGDGSILNAVRNATNRCSMLLRSCEVCHEINWSSDISCSYCHETFDNKLTQHFLESEKNRKQSSRLEMPPGSLPSRIQLLKLEISSMEVAIPLEALKSTWTDAQRKCWASKLKDASSSGEIFQLMMELESAIHREWLSPLYETAEELLEITTNGNNASIADSGTTLPSVLPWIPQTTAAVALRLLIMDAAIYYSHEQKQLKLKMADTKTNELVEMINTEPLIANITAEETSDEDSSSSEEEKSDDLIDGTIKPSLRGRGRGGRGRGRGGRPNLSRTIIRTDEIPKVSKGRAKPSSVNEINDDMVEVVKSRGRGRGRGRGRSRGRGRGSNRGGRSSTQGRGGRGSRGGRQSPAAKKETKVIKISITGLQKKQPPKQVVDQEQLDTDDDSSPRMEWDEQGYEEENYTHYDNFSEGNASDDSGEQGISSGPEQEEQAFDYDIDNDDYDGGDVERVYTGGDYANPDSGEEDEQFDGELMGGEEDEEGEDNEDFQSESSRESE